VSAERIAQLECPDRVLGPLRIPSAIVLRDVLHERLCRDLALEVHGLTDGSGGELHHEVVPGEPTPRLCRVERAIEVFPAAAEAAEALAPLADLLLGRSAGLLKDKLNVKPPGGAGYRPHQDAFAYGRFRGVVTLAIALTACTVESGCLWAAPEVDSPLPTDRRGCVAPEVLGALRFATAPLRPGDTLAFTGFSPHYSEANATARPRSLLLLTYAPAEPGGGSIREEYYRWRASSIGADRSTLSTIDDFEGALADGGARSSAS
jgi:Phytanoyl-CoA dioxygenase (PhyH)